MHCHAYILELQAPTSELCRGAKKGLERIGTELVPDFVEKMIDAAAWP